MKAVSFMSFIFVVHVKCYDYHNETLDAAGRQLQDFKEAIKISIGLQTTSAGEPVEIRDTVTINSDSLNNQYNLDLTAHVDAERIPERLVHAKGVGAFGYFEVINDVSKYTKADVFNGVGKKTQVVVRFSTSRQQKGGPDLGREFKALAVKFYTKEGNLDFTCLQTPIFMYKDPLEFAFTITSLRDNPRTKLPDVSMQWDFTTLSPNRLIGFLWLFSDIGIPKNYRTMDQFPIHTYEINNKNGETYYVKFNFRTEQGKHNLTSAEALAISSEDPDYYTRDLYNAIAGKKYPSWILEMDVMSVGDIKKVNYDPFDVTILWKKGTYHTVTIGRLVVDRLPINHFKDSEQSAYNPGNLVPGIPGPVDFVFKARRMLYRDTQNYRLGINHNDIDVNLPKYRRTYNRDGVAPVKENMKDTPNYYPNSFNGPAPYVDDGRPTKKLLVLNNNAVDFNEISYFYNHVLENDAHRQRTAENIAGNLQQVYPNIAERAIKLLTLGDPDLGHRIARSLHELKMAAKKRTTRETYKNIAQCLEINRDRISVEMYFKQLTDSDHNMKK